MKFRLLVAGLCLLTAARAATPTEDAIALYRAKDFPAARAALEKITAAEPNNAAACYYFGMTLMRRGDPKALPDAVPWLEKAAKLEPTNATYLSDYGGCSMQLAGRTRSLTAATNGRDAMEKSLTIDPDLLDAREGLWRFYTEAPWPIGSSSKAAKHLEEIRRRDSDRATVITVVAKAQDKDYATAFRLCEEVLAKNPENYTALYQYGRTASLSGQNLPRGLASLQKCLTLTPPGPSAPQPTQIWNRIGIIEEKLGHRAEARAAFETSVKLDPIHRAAADALIPLK
jgi:tetratricopeptide (TPR) repeat protein